MGTGILVYPGEGIFGEAFPSRVLCQMLRLTVVLCSVAILLVCAEDRPAASSSALSSAFEGLSVELRELIPHTTELKGNMRKPPFLARRVRNVSPNILHSENKEWCKYLCPTTSKAS